MIFYSYVYTEHTNDSGDWCPFAGRPVESGVLDDTDPNAHEDDILCPQDCTDSAVEHSDNEGDDSDDAEVSAPSA